MGRLYKAGPNSRWPGVCHVLSDGDHPLYMHYKEWPSLANPYRDYLGSKLSTLISDKFWEPFEPLLDLPIGV